MAFETSFESDRNRSPGKWSSLLQRSYASEIFYEQFRSETFGLSVKFTEYKSSESFSNFHQFPSNGSIKRGFRFNFFWLITHWVIALP